MANLAELWLKEYGEASRLADEFSKMLSECGSLPPSEPATQRHVSSMIRRMRILSARLGNLETNLTSIPRKSRFSLLRKFTFTSDKEMRKRQEMLSNLRAREQQMASALDQARRVGAGLDDERIVSVQTQIMREQDEVLDRMGETAFITKHIALDQARGVGAGLDDERIVSVQTQIMREQDEVLDRLGETAFIMKHTALAMNEIVEQNLHTRLTTDIWDHSVGPTDSRLQRVQNRLAILNKRNKAGCSCMCLLPSVLVILILAGIVLILLKYL